jgi:heme oxygenase
MFKRPAATSRSLLDELREATREAHGTLDRELSASRAFEERTSHVDFLRASYHAVAALESALSEAENNPLQGRPRAALLAEDLADLEAALPAAGSLPDRQPTCGQALGLAYVLLGSSLGGQVLARRVDAAFGSGVIPTRYLRSNGQAVGAQWRAFLSALDAWGERSSAEQRASACAAARSAFTLFSDSFRRFRVIA